MADIAQAPRDDIGARAVATGADCDCAGAACPERHLGWRATLGLLAAGAALLLVIVKLLGGGTP